MTHKYTPTPWIVKTAANGDKGIVAVGHGIIAECFVAIRSHDERSPEADANATLMAAAPAMLDALHFAVALANTANNWDIGPVDYNGKRYSAAELCIQFHAAIKMATGGAP